MKASITALCAGSLLFFSCENEKETASDKPATTIDSITQTTAPAQMPVSETNTTTTFETTTPQNTASSSSPNPAHGEPGHRCDIAVGAPLNSPPSATPAAPVTTTSPATFNPPPVAPINTKPAAPVNTTPTTTAPGMNPPHGEPGHDCGIAVGAPLNK